MLAASQRRFNHQQLRVQLRLQNYSKTSHDSNPLMRMNNQLGIVWDSKMPTDHIDAAQMPPIVQALPFSFEQECEHCDNEPFRYEDETPDVCANCDGTGWCELDDNEWEQLLELETGLYGLVPVTLELRPDGARIYPVHHWDLAYAAVGVYSGGNKLTARDRTLEAIDQYNTWLEDSNVFEVTLENPQTGENVGSALVGGTDEEVLQQARDIATETAAQLALEGQLQSKRPTLRQAGFFQRTRR